MTAPQLPAPGVIKDAATDFLRLVTSGRIREAFERHVAPDFRHHNPWFGGSADSLKGGMEENAAEFPDKRCEIQRALEDGDLVAVHSHVQLKPGESGMAVVHLFRFQGDRIIELWDVGQPVPAESTNSYGMF